MTNTHASDLDALQQYCRIQMFVPEAKLTSLEDLSPKLLDELTKDLKDAIEKHNKELEKVQKDFGLFGRSILKMSGHQDQSDAGAIDPADKLVKLLEGLGDTSPKLSSVITGSNKTVIEPSSNTKPKKSATNLNIKEPRQGESTFDGLAHKDSTENVLVPVSTKKDDLIGTVDQLDDDAIVQAIDEALKANKFEPKENTRSIARLCCELEKLTLKLQELNTVMPSLKDSLSLKADKRDLQKLARFVKEQLERPENAIFTGKPLYGFKCMSCDHAVEKLSRVTGDHMPTNRMPPQILPMLSAERIFSLDRRSSNDCHGSCMPPLNSAQAKKSWGGPANFGAEGTMAAHNGNFGSPREKRPQRATPVRKGSPKKAAT